MIRRENQWRAFERNLKGFALPPLKTDTTWQYSSLFVGPNELPEGFVEDPIQEMPTTFSADVFPIPEFIKRYHEDGREMDSYRRSVANGSGYSGHGYGFARYDIEVEDTKAEEVCLRFEILSTSQAEAKDNPERLITGARYTGGGSVPLSHLMSAKEARGLAKALTAAADLIDPPTEG